MNDINNLPPKPTPPVHHHYVSKYFKYLGSSLRHPSSFDFGNPGMFGWLTFLFTAFFNALAIYWLLDSLERNILNVMRNYGFKALLGNGTVLNFSFKFMIFNLVYFLIVILITYWTRYYLLKDRRQKLGQFVVGLGSITARQLLVSVICAVLVMIGGSTMIIMTLLLFVVNAVILQVGSIIALTDAHSNSDLPKFYAIVGSQLVIDLIMGLLIRSAVMNLINQFIQILQTKINGF